MKANIGKGTEMYMFLGDMFKLFSDYWIAEDTEEYWKQLKNASEELLIKYKGCDFFELAKAILLVFSVFCSEKLKGDVKGHWEVSFTREN